MPELTKDAAEAGASHALLICPGECFSLRPPTPLPPTGRDTVDMKLMRETGYFSFTMKDDRAAILAFFNGVMDKSPIPVMINNFP